MLPDITVEQALKKINKIHCIIIPPYYSNGLLNDPRIDHLLKSEIPFLVIPEDSILSQTKPVCSPCKRGSASLQEKITYVPNDDDYLNFTRQLAIYFSNYSTNKADKFTHIPIIYPSMIP